ncbi:DEAD/DEAH box helicase [Glaciimonas immobilis]|uniref:Superfamily II DNA or RNA helicase n=1 Tax=Glaciimonas immobilis TaxID=728004 RepID=A0A840RWK0_9BURK|nr:DEAD/DEAH box helicase family protein [Glaciimonas immobilis]KAF3997519.1 DEAD/DEAH box helicase family protein [Glaciimonas immobilis]MBB5200799.1 superfamily II DNA or RNA helicase [Glaciimonas immobilis]
MTPNYASAKFPEPRPFQATAREKLRAGFVAGHRCQMVMSPTGSGKTILAMFLIHESLLRGKRVIFVADRKTLINQTSEVADSLGLISHGVLMSNHWRCNPSLPFQIASAQTLARRNWPDADLIIIDEAHTQLKAWTEHIPTCRAAVIGLSATPFSNGLGKLFSNLINATTMHELTESGVLVPMRVMSCTKVNMHGAATAGGEWTDKAAEERGMEIVGDVVHEWIKHAENRKTIVFGSTIAHVQGMVAEFNNAGIMAAAFTADTTEAERKEILADFKAPDSILRVLVSVEALAKGFDQKDVSCVADCRPLRKSLSTAIQMWGRGLRSSPETGKTDLLLLDFSGNIVRFSEDYETIYHDGLDALDMGEKLDKTIRKDEDEEVDHAANCPKCQYVPFRKRCISCGFEIVRVNMVEHEAGVMTEFKVGKKTVGDKLSVWEQAVTLCRGQGNQSSAKGRAAHLYKSITGVFPRNLPDFDVTRNVPVSREVLNKAKSNSIAYRSQVKS